MQQIQLAIKSPPLPFQILIQNAIGRETYPTLVEPDFKVSVLKEHCAALLRVHPSTLVLNFAGEVLNDEEVLAKYGIEQGCNVLFFQKDKRAVIAKATSNSTNSAPTANSSSTTTTGKEIDAMIKKLKQIEDVVMSAPSSWTEKSSGRLKDMCLQLSSLASSVHERLSRVEGERDDASKQPLFLAAARKEEAEKRLAEIRGQTPVDRSESFISEKLSKILINTPSSLSDKVHAR